jgi:hypothetical protein
LPKLAAEDKTPIETYSIRLRTDVYAQILGYGSYLNEQNPSTIGHVITEAFSAAIKGDADWKAFWEKNGQKFQTAVADAAPAKRGRKPKPQPRAA